jgi:RimJ/RimL family protein N-acetyltransferase
VHDHDSTIAFRPIAGRHELDLFRLLPNILDGELAADLDDGRRRPEWLWLALRDGRPVARAAWWGRDGSRPEYLDTFDVDAADPDRVEIAARMLRAAMAEVVPAGERPPECILFLPPGWRDDPAARRSVEDRRTALERTGARLLVERLRLEWRPGTPLAAPDGRLAFRPPHSTGELLDLMTAVLDGTLDAHSRRDTARMPAREAALRHYEGELARYASPRSWWRVATLPGGEPAGFVIPARNDYNAIIAYLGILPAHRGNGYIDGVLAEGTRILAAEGAPRIRASTDEGNVPMARAFHRAGYVTFERQIDMAWPG